MAKRINGVVYFWVDTIYDEDLIYDIYESENGKRIKVVVGCLY